MLRDLYKKWSKAKGVMHIAVGYERYGAQSDDEYFQEQMERERFFFQIEELNWTRDNTTSKRERVERLEPDFRNGRFYLPLAVWNENVPSVWDVDLDPESKTFGTIQYREVQRLTTAQDQAIQSGNGDLIAKAIKRVNQDGRVYDVTKHFMSEYEFFPFGEYKDLIDASSRIYDMEPRAPQFLTKDQTEPAQFWDS